jgi:4,5-DOPA dioxygenase extradiol
MEESRAEKVPMNELWDVTTDVMPLLFVGHGSPMNALEDNEFTRAWSATAGAIPLPKAILSVSAHWETRGTLVTAMEEPETIHDFYGFPQALSDVRYPAPGAPALATLLQGMVRTTTVQRNTDWGLDHGTWSVLSRMFPGADIPVLQLSLDRTQKPASHYALGRELAPLRRRGVLILGSGNMVHNLALIRWQDTAYEWASEFDDTLARLILAKDHQAIVNYEELGENARLSVPTREHFLPLLYILALQEEDEHPSFFATGVTLGSISMRSVLIK